MKPICPVPLTQAIKRVMSDITLLTDNNVVEINPQKLDGLARSVSTYVKALADLETYNAAASKAANEKTYSTYEKIPPPSPEERKRFYKRLKSLIRDVRDGSGEEDGNISKPNTQDP